MKQCGTCRRVRLRSHEVGVYYNVCPLHDDKVVLGVTKACKYHDEVKVIVNTKSDSWQNYSQYPTK